MKSLSTLLISMVAASTTWDQTAPQSVYDHDLEIIDWYTQAGKGMWFGFYKGFFHDKHKPDSRCLSDSVHDEVQSVM